MNPSSALKTPKTNVAEASLAPWPLPPTWIMAGSPEASGKVLSKSSDARIVRGIWACTPGQFSWPFTYDETVMVAQGRATVTLEDGEEVTLQAGDMAFFARGQNSVWTIHEPFRKAFHADSPDPLPF